MLEQYHKSQSKNANGGTFGAGTAKGPKNEPPRPVSYSCLSRCDTNLRGQIMFPTAQQSYRKTIPLAEHEPLRGRLGATKLLRGVNSALSLHLRHGSVARESQAPNGR